MKFAVIDGKLTYGERVLGVATALYADANEGVTGRGVVGSRQNPERIDYLLVTDEPNVGKVVGIESKTVDDLVSSWMAGRLQRQFRVLLETCDYQVLLLRGGQNWHDVDGEPEVRNDLLKFQMMGGFVMFGPRGSPLSTLGDLKEVLSGSRNVRTAIARYEKREYTGTPQERALQKILKGVGPVTAAKLMKELGGLVAVLTATEEALVRAGANKGVVRARRELLGA